MTLPPRARPSFAPPAIVAGAIRALAPGAVPDATSAPIAARATPEEWEDAVRFAEASGTGGVLAVAVDRLGLELPDSAARILAERETLRRFWRAHVETALADATGALARAGVRCACLKGPPLAERLYGRPHARESSDVDLLVAERDFERAAEALAGVGYAAPADARFRYMRRRHHHVEFVRPDSAPVELHFRLQASFGRAIASEPFLDRAVERRRSDGSATLALAPEDEYFHLAVHAARHLWDRLVWAADLAVYPTRPEDGFDSGRVLATAREEGARAALAATLATVRDAFGPVLPPALAESARPGPAARVALRGASARNRLPIGSPKWVAATLALQAALCDGPGDAAKFLVENVGRVARRRIRRAFPRLAPEDWAG